MVSAPVEHPPSFDDGRPAFDHALAKTLIGKSVLVGMTTVDRRGKVESQRQVHGIVVSAHARTGFVLELKGAQEGEAYRLPPDTRAFSEAHPGLYTLRETGESVEHPDYTASWTITRPDA